MYAILGFILILFSTSYHRGHKHLDKTIARKLKLMLDENNVHAKAFRKVRDMLNNNDYQDLKLKLISDRPGDRRVYNWPTVFEVAALIIWDIDPASKRDSII